jgi:GH43 family beta-xylosidase
VVWTKHSSGEMGVHIWAPELHFIDGEWYLYLAAGRTDDGWASRSHVLASDGANPLSAQRPRGWVPARTCTSRR